MEITKVSVIYSIAKQISNILYIVTLSPSGLLVEWDPASDPIDQTTTQIRIRIKRNDSYFSAYYPLSKIFIQLPPSVLDTSAPHDYKPSFIIPPKNTSNVSRLWMHDDPQKAFLGSSVKEYSFVDTAAEKKCAEDENVLDSTKRRTGIVIDEDGGRKKDGSGLVDKKRRLDR
jgi:hypothetical protein